MKVNILFTIEEMARHRAHEKASSPVGYTDPNLHVRATGRSTGIALGAIGQAMQPGNQGCVFDAPVDHYLDTTTPPAAPKDARYSNAERVAQSRQLDLMRDLVDRLGLKGFTFNKTSRTYSYQVIYEV